jgi:hypothetical protein
LVKRGSILYHYGRAGVAGVELDHGGPTSGCWLSWLVLDLRAVHHVRKHLTNDTSAKSLLQDITSSVALSSHQQTANAGEHPQTEIVAHRSAIEVATLTASGFEQQIIGNDIKFQPAQHTIRM